MTYLCAMMALALLILIISAGLAVWAYFNEGEEYVFRCGDDEMCICDRSEDCIRKKNERQK